MQQEIIFALTIDTQEMQVRYRPRYLSDYGHFEFRSPHEPPRRIPVSETGYRSHFAPMWEIEATPSVEEYQPAQKWLKDRKGRQLNFEDITHYQKIIIALTETDRLMKEIDEVWR